MTKETKMTNDENDAGSAGFGLRHSSLIRHSTFGFRHSGASNDDPRHRCL